MPSTISIIIPAYNAASFLGETLESVVSQTLRDWELVVVDDGSRDGTAALVEQWASRDGRIRLVRQANGGVAAARNRGYAESAPASEFVIFLDHDDVWEPEALETLRRALETHPACVAAHGLARKTDRRGRPVEARDEGVLSRERRKLAGRRVVRCAPDEPTSFAVLAYDGCLCTPGLGLIRRSALADMPLLFDQKLAPSDDADFWVRLSLRGDIAFVDQVVLQWRQHESNVSGNEWTMVQAMSQARRNLIALPELTPAQRRLAHGRYRRLYASVERHNAQDCLRWAGEALARRQPGAALRRLAQGLGLFGRYLRLRLFWGGLTDRGPIPLRLKDQARLMQSRGHLPPADDTACKSA